MLLKVMKCLVNYSLAAKWQALERRHPKLSTFCFNKSRKYKNNRKFGSKMGKAKNKLTSILENCSTDNPYLKMI
jgi:hypothetical protein